MVRLTPRQRFAAAVIAVPALLAAFVRPALADVSETQVKAAFLYKFGYFVEWPAAAFPSSDAPLILCVVGNDPFGSILDDLVKDQKVGARSIVVRRMPTIARDSGCHIAFIAGPSAPQTTQTLVGSDVLTVTDAGSDQAASGIINFVIKDDRVRFNINDAAAAKGGLSISSRLLNLALAVTPRR